jgi:putative hydrolase of the HAD superfamily
MRTHQAAIFDLYGTLVDFPFAGYEAVVSEMAALLDLPTSDFVREWKITWIDHEMGAFASTGAHIAQVCTSLDKRATAEKVYAAECLHRAYQEQIFVPKSGSIELLTALKRRGYKTGLISNCPLETKELWPTSPLAALIDMAIFSTVERIRKPDPAVFALACARLQVEPCHCAMVGDSWHADVLGAHHAGMAAYWLNPAGAPLPDEKVATNIVSLAELLENLS